MERVGVLASFFERTVRDARLSVSHLGLFLALYQCWSDQQFKEPLEVFGSTIRAASKINSSSTYHRLIKQLHSYGYIRYEPSFYKQCASRIYFTADQAKKKQRNQFF